MPTLVQYRLECRRLLHDATGKFWSNTELDDYINDARLRVCSDTGCLRRLVTGYLTAGLEQYAIGSVTGVSIVNGGSGYVSPTIVFAGGDPTTPAAATAVVSSGVITGLTFTSYGEGYLSAPTVTVVGGNDEVVSLTITNPGIYTSVPAISFTGGSGSGAAASASLGINSFLKTAGTGYAVGDLVTFLGGTYTRPLQMVVLAVLGGGAILVTLTVDFGDYSVLPTGGSATSTSGSGSGCVFTAVSDAFISSVALTAGGSGYTSAPTVGITGSGHGAITAAVGSGSGASIIASVLPMKTLDILNITPIWGNQRVPLRYMPFTELNARMRSWIPNPQRPVVWSRYGTSGATAFIQPVPDQNYTTEFDTAITPEALATDNEEDIIQYPYTSPVAYYACWKAKLKQQSYSEGEAFLADYKRKVIEAQAAVQMRRIPNPFYGYTGA